MHIVLVVSQKKKKIGSTAGMQQSLDTASMMNNRNQIVDERIKEIKWAFSGVILKYTMRFIEMYLFSDIIDSLRIRSFERDHVHHDVCENFTLSESENNEIVLR